MKRFFTGAALFFAMAAFSLSGQGVAMPFYAVDVEVECASPEKAAKAELKFLPLPEGKEVAFSCRWDDSSLNHQRTLDLMKKHNYQGTFYLTGGGRAEFWKKVFPDLCKDGFTVGNHTLSHKHLPFLTLETIHYEILWWNILLECRADRPITILVMPFGSISTPHFPGISQLIGKSVQRTGIIGGADISPQLYARYGLPQNEFFTPRLISPGDREPDCKKFDAQITRHLNSSDKPLYLTLGVHSWHTDKGLVELGKSLAKYGNNPKWWYCTAPEFSAYRFMALNSRVKSRKVEGKRVRFTVELPDPAFLGSATPLWGECGGKTFAIPHTRKLPGKIALADKDGKNEKFPAIVTTLESTSSGALTLKVKNTGAPLENVLFSFRLPPAYDFVTKEGAKMGVYQISVDRIGESFTCTTPAVLPNGKVPRGAGNEIMAAQMDFNCGKLRGRIWNVLTVKKAAPAAENHKLSISSKGFSAAEAKELSLAAKSVDSSFRNVAHMENWRPGAYQLRLAPQKELGKKITVMMCFKGKGKMTLRGELPKVVYCNGQELKVVNSSVSLGELQGDCRVVFVYPPQTRSQKNIVLLLKED